MKIKLFFVHPKNHGNMMMVASFINSFSDILSEMGETDVAFYLDVMDEEELTLARKSLPSSVQMKSEILYDKKRRGIIGKLEKLFYVPIEIIYNIRHYDACVVLGGDCISEYYSKQKFVFNMIKFHFISKRIPVYALGQTMGPFSSKYMGLVRWGLRYCKIYGRDDDCCHYLREQVGLTSVREARDLALLDIPFQNDPPTVYNTMKKYIGDIECRYITYVPSGANLQYTSDTEHYIDEYIRMITGSIRKYDVNVLLLAHVIHTDTSNDKAIIDRIMEKMPEEYKRRIHCINYLILPYEARILLAHGLFTVTGRMHAAVSSINTGTIPICLSYSIKYKGVIGDPYGLNDLIVQCRGNESWEGHNISDIVAAMQERLLEEKEKYERSIEAYNPKNREMAFSQIKETAQDIMTQRKGQNNEKVKG